MSDILLDLANKRGDCLGIKLDEFPTKNGRRLIYEIAEKNIWGEWIFAPFRWMAESLGISRIEKDYVTMFPKSSDDKLVTQIEYTCPNCAEVDYLRILCGAGIDRTEPNKELLIFGKWDITLNNTKTAQEIITEQAKHIDKLKARVMDLAPIEREIDILRVDNEEKKALLLQADTLLSEISSENSRLSGELGKMYQFGNIKAQMSPKNIAEQQDAAERMASADQMLKMKEDMLKGKTEMLNQFSEHEKHAEKTRDELEMDINDLRKKLRDKADYGHREARGY